MTTPPHLADTAIGPDEIHLPVRNPGRTKHIRDDIDADHAGNFVRAVKVRRDPLGPVEVGHPRDDTQPSADG